MCYRAFQISYEAVDIKLLFIFDKFYIDSATLPNLLTFKSKSNLSNQCLKTVEKKANNMLFVLTLSETHMSIVERLLKLHPFRCHATKRWLPYFMMAPKWRLV